MPNQTGSESDIVHVFITGGTIDSVFDAIHDTVVPRETSTIPKYLSAIQPRHPLEFTELCMKDSRELTQDDLENLVKAIESSSATKVLITHGTYTMPDSARFLEARLKRKDQVIILTGSIIPLDGFTFSDGGFNLGFAMAKLEALPPGIYVSMNGNIFSPAEVMKLLSEGRFSSIFNTE